MIKMNTVSQIDNIISCPENLFFNLDNNEKSFSSFEAITIIEYFLFKDIYITLSTNQYIPTSAINIDNTFVKYFLYQDFSFIQYAKPK